MLKFTLLTSAQIWGDNDGKGQLDAIEKYGRRVAPTDFALLLGGETYKEEDRTCEGDLACVTGTASGYASEDYVISVDFNGRKTGKKPYDSQVSVRPALSPLEASKIGPIEVKTTISGVGIAEYGEYPQMLVDEHISNQLESLYRSASLHPTGKKYTCDTFGLNHCMEEYEFEGKRYVCVEGYYSRRLSSGEQSKEGKNYWVEVQPIQWLIDESGWMISKKCLFAGGRFHSMPYDDNFPDTLMKHHLDTYFAKDIIPSEHATSRQTDKNQVGEKSVEAEKEKNKTTTKRKTITPERHALAELLNKMRYDYGCEARVIAKKNKSVQELREKIRQ